MHNTLRDKLSILKRSFHFLKYFHQRVSSSSSRSVLLRNKYKMIEVHVLQYSIVHHSCDHECCHSLAGMAKNLPNSSTPDVPIDKVASDY